MSEIRDQRSEVRGRKSEVSRIIDLRPLIPDVRFIEPDKPNKPYKPNGLNELNKPKDLDEPD